MISPTTQPSSGRADRAVSPVVGVVLMVAITVVLSASVGAFVINMGSTIGRTPPQATLNVADAPEDFDGEEFNDFQDFIVIQHGGGDRFLLADISIIIRWASSNEKVFSLIQSEGDNHLDSGSWNVTLDGSPVSPETVLEPGDILTISYDRIDDDSVTYEVFYDVLVLDHRTDKPIVDTSVMVS